MAERIFKWEWEADRKIEELKKASATNIEKLPLGDSTGGPGIKAESRVVGYAVRWDDGLGIEDKKREVKDRLIFWIDRWVIANALVDAMSEVAEPEKMTFENAKAFYYKFLETELVAALKRSIR